VIAAVLAQSGNLPLVIASGAVIFVTVGAAVFLGGRPVAAMIRRQQEQFDTVLRGSLLLDVPVRTAMILWFVTSAMLAGLVWLASGSMLGLALGLAVGAMLPSAVLGLLKRRRLAKIEDQLIGGIQTLASGVRAGLNLVQSMQMIARDGPQPLRQEFAHLVREYEYGLTLEDAMVNAADRIGSGDFRLLMAALQTHRQRGGDLGTTLDRIAGSIREIQRLEGRVRALTAQGRTTARWLGAMPMVVLVILYFLVSPEGVKLMFIDPIGKIVLLTIVVLNVVGFVWIRKIVSLDI
jgi:tight adherence protein B